MLRQDLDLAWMLQYENIAWYEDGKVYILDRRIYPIDVKKVVCNNHREVAAAIKDMVTRARDLMLPRPWAWRLQHTSAPEDRKPIR